MTALGFTVKSGWARSVLLAGPPNAPRVVDSLRVELSDPSKPESRQPYHDGFGTARAAGDELTQLVDSAVRFGRRSVMNLIEQYKKEGHQVAGIGLVVGSLVDPERLGNSHVRIHALEGQLFRGIVVDAAVQSSLAYTIWRERDLYPDAITRLKRSNTELRRALTQLGLPLAASWRAEHKVAALAAWLVLSG